jgi:hypothetical protein
VSPTPHPDGIVTLTVAYSFPDTVASSQRSIEVRAIRAGESSGHFWGYFRPEQTSGTLTLTHELFCSPSGVYNYIATAHSCGRQDRMASATASHAHEADPTVSVSYLGPDDQGNGKVRVNYKFPNTGAPNQRNLQYLLSTGFGKSYQAPDREGGMGVRPRDPVPGDRRLPAPRHGTPLRDAAGPGTGHDHSGRQADRFRRRRAGRRLPRESRRRVRLPEHE